MIFNLDQLSKIVDCLAKESYFSLSEKNDMNQSSAFNTIQPDRAREFMSMSKYAKSSIETLLEKL
jgi:hypothetical protein